MKSRATMVAAALVLTAVIQAAAQVLPAKPPVQAPPTNPSAQAPPRATTVPAPRAQAPVTARPAAAPAAARASIALIVTDASGTAIPDVHVIVAGPVAREGTTGRDGGLDLQALKAGTYRIRLESPDFITLEREVTIKAGPHVEVDVTLDRAPPRPVEPPPTPAPTATREATTFAPDANATLSLIALPDWIEKNLVGRTEPQKETVVGRTLVTTASVVQVRDPIKERVRADADEMLYVIAGEGVMRAKGREQLLLNAGSFVVIPRGVTYSLERRGGGRNPLVVLSIVGK